jgi:hypothetical protein
MLFCFAWELVNNACMFVDGRRNIPYTDPANITEPAALAVANHSSVQ